MAKDELDQLGLGESGEYERKPVNIGEREQKGFVAGVNVKTARKWFFW